MSKARSHRANSVSFEFQGDIEGQIGEFFSQVKEKALRPATHQMALVLHDEMRQRVPVHMGKLQEAIYRWFDEKASGDDRKTYVVGVNKRKAPHWWLVEHGHWRRFAVVQLPGGEWITLKDKPLATPEYVPAQPYFRTSIDAKLQAAVEAGRKRLAEKIGEIQSA